MPLVPKRNLRLDSFRRGLLYRPYGILPGSRQQTSQLGCISMKRKCLFGLSGINCNFATWAGPASEPVHTSSFSGKTIGQHLSRFLSAIGPRSPSRIHYIIVDMLTIDVDTSAGRWMRADWSGAIARPARELERFSPARFRSYQLLAQYPALWPEPPGLFAQFICPTWSISNLISRNRNQNWFWCPAEEEVGYITLIEKY